MGKITIVLFGNTLVAVMAACSGHFDDLKPVEKSRCAVFGTDFLKGLGEGT